MPPRAWVDWFPCVFMRGTRRSLGVAFPTLRLPLERPVTRRMPDPFTGREVEVQDFDPAPVGSAARGVVCEPPSRPPLPFVPFPSAGYWHEELPDLLAAATGVVIRDDAADGPFETLALYGDAELHGAPLRVFAVPPAFREALAALDVAGQESLARRWNEALAWDRERTEPPHAERRRKTVSDLARLSREAAAAEELLYVWSNT